MHDPDAGRDEAESLEGLLTPLQKFVTLAVAFELHLHVQTQRLGRAGEIDLDRMIHDQIDRHERLDDFWIAAEVLHRAAHRREIDHERNAGEILEDDARDDEGNFLVGRRFRVPFRQRLDVFSPNLLAVAISQDRLEHDANADRQPGNRPDALRFERRERMQKSFAAVAGVELLQRLEFVIHILGSLASTKDNVCDFVPSVRNHFSSASFALILSKFGSAFASSLLSAY